MQIHLYFIGIPLLVVLALALPTFIRKGPHPASYKLPDKWTHAPILWAASDADVGDAHGGHATSEFSVGGGASGTW